MLYDKGAQFIADRRGMFEDLDRQEGVAREQQARARDRQLGQREQDDASRQADKARRDAGGIRTKLAASERPGFAIHHWEARRGSVTALREAWEEREYGKPTRPIDDLKTWKLANWFKDSFDSSHQTISDVSALPLGSFVVSFKFQLKTPFLSGGDDALYPIDNPILRDRVFGVPLIALSSWKGALRATMREQHPMGTTGDSLEDQLGALFGSSSDGGDDIERRAGRVRFFPTFFDRMGLEVINPHNRQTKVGARGPISMECVPRGGAGWFRLLYVPFDQIGQKSEDIRLHTMYYLRAIGLAVVSLLTTRGIGAKTSSGFGLVQDNLVEPVRPLVKLHDERALSLGEMQQLSEWATILRTGRRQ